MLTSAVEQELMVTGLYRVSASDAEIKELRSILDNRAT